MNKPLKLNTKKYPGRFVRILASDACPSKRKRLSWTEGHGVLNRGLQFLIARLRFQLWPMNSSVSRNITVLLLLTWKDGCKIPSKSTKFSKLQRSREF